MSAPMQFQSLLELKGRFAYAASESASTCVRVLVKKPQYQTLKLNMRGTCTCEVGHDEPEQDG